VERFIRRFEPSYRQLAFYAALPLVLTPELLHYLRNQFLRHAQLPWVAEADLLLSDLCNPIGYEQYAMDTAVRAYLVAAMEQELGAECLQAVAKLLLRYVQHLEMMNPYLSRQDLQAQQWAAMVYVNDNQRQTVARQLADAYQTTTRSGETNRLSTSAQAEMARLSRLTEELAPQLKAYPQLLDYARVVGQLLTDPKEIPPNAVRPSYEVVEGITLEVPEDLIASLPQGSSSVFKGFPALESFDFIDAQLDDEIDSTFPPDLQLDEFTVITFQAETEPSQELAPFEFTVATLQHRSAQQQRTRKASQQQANEWVIHRQQQRAYRFIEPLTSDLTLEMVAIPSGSFLMGSPESESERYDDESPQHEVTVESFFMGRYSVTQAQWRFVAGLPQVNRELDPDPSSFKGDHRPVESVSWHDAVEFCARLTALTGRPYRLPTEAEWEYACRAGTTTPFHFGDMITTEVANYNGSAYADGPAGESRGETTAVDQFGIANVFGLSDMHGNVLEWCQDHWHENYDDAPTDGSAWLTEQKYANRVFRGGAWYSLPRYCRSASRAGSYPGGRTDVRGFRVVCSAPRALP
jgi:formylglycine-generating enzyme required for sulfatase activity